MEESARAGVDHEQGQVSEGIGDVIFGGGAAAAAGAASGAAGESAAEERGHFAASYERLLGPPPLALYKAGKYHGEVAGMLEWRERPSAADTRRRIAAAIGADAAQRTSPAAAPLVDLLARLLAYDPAERPSAAEALRHPFLAPVFPFAAVGAPGVGGPAPAMATDDIALPSKSGDSVVASPSGLESTGSVGNGAKRKRGAGVVGSMK